MNWNLGYFGILFGGAAWMTWPPIFLGHTGLIPIAIGLIGICWIIGITQWRRRNTISAHTGTQTIIWIIGIATAAFLIAYDRSGLLGSLDKGFQEEPRQMYLILLLTPLLSFFIWYQNGRQKTTALDTTSD